MKRSQLTLVAAAALVVLGLWLLLDESRVGNDDARPAPTADALRSASAAVRPSAAPDAAATAEQRAAVAAAVADQGSSVDAKTPTSASPAAAWGRLVVVDEQGRESLEEDGVLALGCRSASGRFEELRASIRSGAWRLDLTGATLTDGAQLEFRHVLVGTRRLRVLSPTTNVPCTAAQDVVVRARRPARTLLRVTDASTKLDLQNVELVRSDSALEVQHPGLSFDEKVIARERVSPIELDDLQDAEFGPRVRLFVGARGYAWRSVELDLESGGERVVALVAGADLSLVVRGVEPASGTVLRIRNANAREPLFGCELARDDTFEIAGLPAGSLTLSAERGAWTDPQPLKLVELSLDLAPATKTNAELVLPAAPSAATAAVRGTLYAPREWALAAPALMLRALEITDFKDRFVECPRGESDRDGFDAFPFSVAGVPVGRCELLLFNPNCSLVFEVPAAGLEGVEFVLPPLAELEFELLDAQTGERAANVRLGWHSTRPSGVDTDAIEWSTLGSDGVHRIRASAGEIKLVTLTNDYEPYEQRLRVAAGDARRIVRLERACTIDVRLRAGGTPLALPRAWSAKPAAVEGQGEVLSARRSGKALTLVVSTPGTYEVSPDPIPGYRTPPPQRVEVQRGAPVSIEFVYEVERP